MTTPNPEESQVPTHPDEAVRLAAEEHAADIMFNPTDEFEDGCVLCEAAIRLGIWEAYGYTEEEMRNGS